jgi:translocation and assembly module TamA
MLPRIHDMRRLTLLSVTFCLMAGMALAQVGLRFEAPGASDDLRAALLAASRSQAVAGEPGPPAQDILAAARSDYARLLAVLYEFGYFGPEISIRVNGAEVAAMSPFRPPASVQSVAITVDPGTAFRLGRAAIAPLAPGTTLPPGFAPGQSAGTRVLRQAAEAGIDGWRAAGHASAAISGQQITARQQAGELDVDIALTPGPLNRFGALIPQGQDRMRADRIARIAGLPEGAQFDPETLTRVADRLRATGVFTSVGLSEMPRAQGSLVDIRADLVEAPLRRLGFGAEIATLDGLSLSGFWLHRNLWGGAERLRFDAELSGLGGADGGFDGLLGLRFSRPADLTPDTTLRFGLQAEHLDEVLFTADSVEAELGLAHQFSDQLTGDLAAMIRFSDVRDAFSDRQILMLALPASLTWDGRDNAFDATQGWYGEAGLTPFTMFEDGSGARLTADLRGYRGFGADNRTRIAARLQLGSVTGGDITALPPDWLFYSGGAGTVRGQGYQSLGALQGGVATGGRSFLGASLELRQDLVGNFGAVAFADFGWISSDAWGAGSSDGQSGAGVGIRYATPIGPIRLDLATPMSGPDAGQDLFLYIGIGQSF